MGIMLLPQALAYALIADLPSIHGLYASWIPPLVTANVITERNRRPPDANIIRLIV